MTKNQLINTIYGAKLDLEYQVKLLKNRLEFNNIDRIKEEQVDDDPGTQMAKRCGAYEAFVGMANTDIKICIQNLEKTLKTLKN
jgi:hypothetical protein